MLDREGGGGRTRVARHDSSRFFTTRLLLLAALVVVAVGHTAASPVSPQPQPARRTAHDLSRLREWIDAVDRHIPGQSDAAARGVGLWSRAQLEVLFVDFESLLQLIAAPDRPRFPRALRAFTLPELQELQDLALREGRRVAGYEIERLQQLAPDEARRTVNRFVKRAVLLHTDVALLVASAADGPAESSIPVPHPLLPVRTSVQLEDGRRVGTTYYGSHWDFARLLLNEVTPYPAADVTVRQWYRAIAAVFASRQNMAESTAHLARARQLFPTDAEIAAANGRLHETYAAPRIQHFLETGVQVGDAALIGSSRSNLRQAEAFFGKAVELDAGFIEARLHLGRVLALEGRHDDAAKELRRASGNAGDPLTQYYAWLFLGIEEQSLGHPDRARESFNTAAALYPRAQSPYLALSQLARHSGDRLGALGAIQHVLTLPADHLQREDPWWTYLAGSTAEAQTRLSAVRAVLFLTPEER